MAVRNLLTYRDYLELPEDGRRYEILEGDLYVTAAPYPGHQRVVRNLTTLLDSYLAACQAGEILPSPLDVILDPSPDPEEETNIAQPDLVYIDATGQSQVVGRGIEGPPTLVIEVLSPSTQRRDRGVKMRVYAERGVRYYWMVDLVR
jgi:Uma2 family endonuclease